MISTSHGELGVDDLEELAAAIQNGLEAVQGAQAEYDVAMWDIDDPKFANLRHIHVHLSITVGKLARLIEPRDHDAFHERPIPDLPSEDIAPIVADLLMHAAQIANVLGHNLGEDFLARYRQNAGRFAPDSRLRGMGSQQESAPS